MNKKGKRYHREVRELSLKHRVSERCVKDVLDSPWRFIRDRLNETEKGNRGEMKSFYIWKFIKFYVNDKAYERMQKAINNKEDGKK